MNEKYYNTEKEFYIYDSEYLVFNYTAYSINHGFEFSLSYLDETENQFKQNLISL